MNTMTTIMEKPMVKGSSKTIDHRASSKEGLTFKKFLGEATKGKEESSLENTLSLKDKDVNPKENEKVLDQSQEDKDQDLEKDTLTASVQMLNILPMNLEVPSEKESTLEIPSLSPTLEGIDAESTGLENTHPLETAKNLIPRTSEEFKIIQANLTEVNPSDAKNLEKNSDTLVSGNLDLNLEMIPEETVIPIMTQVISEEKEIIDKSTNTNQFKEESLNTDIEDGQVLTHKVKAEPNPLEDADLKKENMVTKNQSPELHKLIQEKLQPQIQTMEEGERVNSKDPGTKDQILSASQITNQGQDFKIEVKNPIVPEVFQKNLEVATEEIMNRVTTLKEGGDSTMTLKLHPEDLGEIEISLHLSEGKVSGKILTDHKDVRELFLKNMDELTHSLKENKVNVLKFEVGGFTQNSFSEGRQEENRRLLQTKSMRAYGQPETKIGQEKSPVRTKNPQSGLNILA